MPCNWNGGNRNCIEYFGGQSQRKRRDGPMRWWEDNIMMDHKEIGCEVGSWMEVAYGLVKWRQLVLAVLNLRVLLPQRSFTSCMERINIWFFKLY
jgi:hypothetical protein